MDRPWLPLRPRPDQLTSIAQVLRIPVRVLLNTRGQLDAEAVHRGAETCGERQPVFAREDEAPPVLQVVLDEAAPVPGPGRQRGDACQLLHLIKRVAPPRLTVQVVRSADNPYAYGAFSLATDDDRDVGCIQTPAREFITNNGDDIAALMAAWDVIRFCALSQRDSIDFIQRTADERWT